MQLFQSAIITLIFYYNTAFLWKLHLRYDKVRDTSLIDLNQEIPGQIEMDSLFVSMPHSLSSKKYDASNFTDY